MAQLGMWRCIGAVMRHVRQSSMAVVPCFDCRCMSTVPQPSLLPSTMSAWQLHEYGSINQLKLSGSVQTPVLCRPRDVLVHIHAASVNPVDVMMLGKWSSCTCHSFYLLMALKIALTIMIYSFMSPKCWCWTAPFPFGCICFVMLVMRKGGESSWSGPWLYNGSFPCAQLPGPVHTARLGRMCCFVYLA